MNTANDNDYISNLKPLSVSPNKTWNNSPLASHQINKLNRPGNFNEESPSQSFNGK